MTATFARPMIRGIAAGAAVLALTALPAAAANEPRNPGDSTSTPATQTVVAPSVNLALTSTPTTAGNPPTVLKARSTGAKVTFSDAKCASFKLSGTPPNQTLACQ